MGENRLGMFQYIPTKQKCVIMKSQIKIRDNYKYASLVLHHTAQENTNDHSVSTTINSQRSKIHKASIFVEVKKFMLNMHVRLNLIDSSKVEGASDRKLARIYRYFSFSFFFHLQADQTVSCNHLRQ